MKLVTKTALAAIAVASVIGLSGAQAAIIAGSGLVVDSDIDDYYFSTSASGSVTIDVTDSGFSEDFDTEINLFFDDGSLDLSDFIENDDDDGDGLESRIIRVLAAGNYLLRVGNFNFGNSTGTDAEIIAATNADTSGSSDYDLSISGEFVTTQEQDSVPEPMTLSLLGAGLAGIGWSRKRRA